MIVNSIKNKVILVPLLLLSLSLFACQRLDAEVSSFSSLEPSTSGESFFILPNDTQAISAEFSQYADSISKRLNKQGWYRVANLDEARYVILLDYGIAGSSTKTGSKPIYGQTGGGTTTHSGTFNTYGSSSGNAYGSYTGTSHTRSTFGVVGSSNYSYSIYQRYFQMRVVDITSDAPVYETKVASEGSSSVFGLVADCIFDVALEDFPLQSSGKKTILMDECRK